MAINVHALHDSEQKACGFVIESRTSDIIHTRIFDTQEQAWAHRDAPTSETFRKCTCGQPPVTVSGPHDLIVCLPCKVVVKDPECWTDEWN